MGDVELATPAINPNARPKPGLLRVERTVMVQDGELVYDTPKTRGSRRRVPLPPVTVDLNARLSNPAPRRRRGHRAVVLVPATDPAETERVAGDRRGQ